MNECNVSGASLEGHKRAKLPALHAPSWAMACVGLGDLQSTDHSSPFTMSSLIGDCPASHNRQWPRVWVATSGSDDLQGS